VCKVKGLVCNELMILEKFATSTRFLNRSGGNFQEITYYVAKQQVPYIHSCSVATVKMFLEKAFYIYFY
jgi:hypothetical protein